MGKWSGWWNNDWMQALVEQASILTHKHVPLPPSSHSCMFREWNDDFNPMTLFTNLSLRSCPLPSPHLPTAALTQSPATCSPLHFKPSLAMASTLITPTISTLQPVTTLSAPSAPLTLSLTALHSHMPTVTSFNATSHALNTFSALSIALRHSSHSSTSCNASFIPCLPDLIHRKSVSLLHYLILPLP